MSKKILIVIMLAAVVCSVVCLTGFAAPIQKEAVAADTLPEAENFSLPTGFTTHAIKVTNQISDFTFNMIGCYRFDKESGMFKFRLYESEVEHFVHYFQKDGYTFDGFAGWVLNADGQYYECDYMSINAAELMCIHTPITYEIVFKDGFSGNTVQTFQASYGSTVKAPAAPDYSDRGLVFTGWAGGPYDQDEGLVVTRYATLYSEYAPARYITVHMPDDKTVRIAVAAGSKLSDVTPPTYAYEFVKWQDVNGNKADPDQIIDYDLELVAIYADGVMPSWVLALIATVSALVVAAVVVVIAVKIKRNSGV